MSLLDQPNVATVSGRRIGEFQFDVVRVETHTSTLNITENPIETGESVADHAFLSPKSLTITGVMVAYEPPASYASLIPESLSFIKEIPLPLNIEAVTTQAQAMTRQVLSKANEVAETARRVIAPFLPNFNEQGQDSSQTVSRVSRAYSDLLQIQKSAELVEVMTGLELYQNMALVEIITPQTDDASAEFTLTLREVFIVETQTAGGLSVKTQGRTKNQSSTASNKGQTQPEDVSFFEYGRRKASEIFQ